jgi:hypothetical protein
MIAMSVFSTAGSNINPSALAASGYPINVQLPAQNFNYFMNGFSIAAQELDNVVNAALGLALTVGTPGGTAGLVGTDLTQVLKSVIAMSHFVGENIESEVAITPVGWNSATFASFATQYRPIVSRQADVDITAAVYPTLVSVLRAEQVNMNVSGVNTNSWTGTSSAGFFTLTAITGTYLAIMNLIVSEAIANGYIQTQTAGAAALYTGSGQMCITVGGTEYPVVSINLGTGAIGVTGTPVGTTMTMFPYRIAGATTSARLRRLSGFVGVAQYDYDGQVVGGFRRMDQMQGHRHIPLTATNGFVVQGSVGAGAPIGAGSGVTIDGTTGNPTTDGTNGTPRTGKTTDPRTRGVYVYTFAGLYIA